MKIKNCTHRRYLNGVEKNIIFGLQMQKKKMFLLFSGMESREI